MAVGPIKLVAVLLFTALLSVQCVASCGTMGVTTGAASHSDDSLPPCHRHHNSPPQQTTAPCCHNSMLSGTDQARLELGSISIAVVPPIAILNPQATVAANVSQLRAAPPPDLTLLPFAVLRI